MVIEWSQELEEEDPVKERHRKKGILVGVNNNVKFIEL